MKNQSSGTTTAPCLSWLKTNVVHEIPIIGHTLTEQNWSAFSHDMKHFFSMLLGMVAMLAIPMPMPMSEHENKNEQVAIQFVFMLIYMYIGMFVANVLFNVGTTGLSSCKAVLLPPRGKSNMDEQTPLMATVANDVT